MRLYFIKAQYTDGIYKLSDFYTGNVYKQDVNKMQDIDLKANDGHTSTVVNTLLPDGTKVNDYSHIIVPEVNKVYEIDRCIYLNNKQTQISLIEDVLIGNYQEVKDKKIRLSRTNDESLFKGIHDIEDITVRPSLKTIGTGSTLTGQWVIYFIDTSSINVTTNDAVIWKMIKDSTGTQRITVGEAQLSYFDSGLDITNSDPDKVINRKYPDVVTTNPLSYNYFNKTIKGTRGNETFTSIYHNGRIKWVEDSFVPYEYKYSESGGYRKGKIEEIKINPYLLLEKPIALAPDLTMVALAFPFEQSIGVLNNENTTFLPYSPEVANAIRSNEWKIRGIKIVNEAQIFNQSTTVSYNNSWTKKYSMKASKNIDFSTGGNMSDRNLLNTIPSYVYDEQGLGIINATEVPESYARFPKVLQLTSLNPELLLDIPTGDDIYQYEPFKRYSVGVFGKEYTISKKNLHSLRIRFAPTLGMVEYFGYINNDLSQKLFSDSFTTDIKWSVDELVLFNQENPTYKDQFNANMWRKGTNLLAGTAKGAIGGALVGNIPGAAVGAATGLITGVMNMGFDAHNEKLREKGLELKPDQTFGDGSSISLASQSKYGVFIHTYTSDFGDTMRVKYELTGFPTSIITTINTLSTGQTEQFGNTKLIKGQLLEVVRNKYTTNEINRRLQEGVILI